MLPCWFRREFWQAGCNRLIRRACAFVQSQFQPTMAHDVDRPDDSNAPRHSNPVAEETSATGQRVKGAIKEELGDLSDDKEMENKGARENAAGKDRQRKNDAV